MRSKKLIIGALALAMILCLSSLLVISIDHETNDNDMVLGSSANPSSISPTKYSTATITVSGATTTVTVKDTGDGNYSDKYVINWGDGSATSETTSTASHRYTSNGTYRISMSITTWWIGEDPRGETSASVSVTIDYYSSSNPTYTVTYNLQGGHTTSGMSTTLRVTSGTTITLPGLSDVDKDGTYLNGWALNSTSGTKYSTLGQYTVRSNVTFYALWANEVYKVYLDANCGVSDYWYTFIVTDQNYRVVLPSDGFSREGYYLDSWNTSADGSGTKYALGSTYTASAEGEKLYAIWKMPTVTLDCDPLDYIDSSSGKIELMNNSAQIPLGTIIQLPKLPASIAGEWIQIQTGWKDQAGNAVDFEYIVPSKETITLSPVKTDYFKIDNTNDPVVSIVINNALSNYFSHTVEWGDGTKSVADSVNSDKLTHTYSVNAVYAITVTSSLYDQSVTGTYQIQVLNASDEHAYTVTFDSKGGSEVASQIILQDHVAMKPTDPSKFGFRFAGWYSDAELTSEYDFNSPVTEDITHYAKWNDESTCIVKFETNGGSEIPEQVIKVNTNAIKPAQPTKDGHRFAGWYSDAELTSEYDFNSPVTQDTTLYASWTEKSNSGGLSSIPWWVWLIVLLIIIGIVLYVIFG